MSFHSGSVGRSGHVQTPSDIVSDAEELPGEVVMQGLKCLVTCRCSAAVSQLGTRKGPPRSSSELCPLSNRVFLGRAVARDSCRVIRTAGRWVENVLGRMTEQRQGAVNGASQISR